MEKIFGDDRISLEYTDYRNFINFVNNKVCRKNEVINKFNFFRIGMCNIKTDKKEFVTRLFSGRYPQIPTFNKEKDSFNNHNRFEDFTSVDEVENLSLWSLSWLKYLSYATEVRLGKELEIIQIGNPRDGRLDIVALAENQLLVLEAKVKLAKLLSEGRYLIQIPNYSKEIKNIVNNHFKWTEENWNVNVLLLIGGEETDLYPPDHPDCTTGKVGNISKIFYESIIEKNIHFISANALWALAVLSEVSNVRIPWFNLLPSLFMNPQTIGLLSGGIVTSQNSKIKVTPLKLL